MPMLSSSIFTTCRNDNHSKERPCRSSDICKIFLLQSRPLDKQKVGKSGAQDAAEIHLYRETALS